MANAKPNIFSRPTASKKTLNDFIRSTLYSPENVQSYMSQFYDGGNVPVDEIARMKDVFQQSSEHPLKMSQIDPNFKNTGFGTSARLLGNQMKNHKLKTAGALGLGAANVAGLFDNPNIVGQLGGGVLGATAVPWAVKQITGNALGPYGKIMTTLGGGALGSLFDTLMAKKAEEQQMQMLQQGGY